MKLVGFVEELMAESDPEYHWSDNFRTSRFSNEERQRTFLQLSGKLRRIVGRKVLEMVSERCVVRPCVSIRADEGAGIRGTWFQGGNAVLGYQQSFDLARENGQIVARALGTACRIRATEGYAIEPVSPAQSTGSPDPARSAPVVPRPLGSGCTPPARLRLYPARIINDSAYLAELSLAAALADGHDDDRSRAGTPAPTSTDSAANGSPSGEGTRIPGMSAAPSPGAVDASTGSPRPSRSTGRVNAAAAAAAAAADDASGDEAILSSSPGAAHDLMELPQVRPRRKEVTARKKTDWAHCVNRDCALCGRQGYGRAANSRTTSSELPLHTMRAYRPGEVRIASKPSQFPAACLL